MICSIGYLKADYRRAIDLLCEFGLSAFSSVLILAVAIEVFYKYVSPGIDSDRMRGLNARIHRQNPQAKG
ncbi:hypothetical protein QUA41_04655 [Microcoleus sp. Pol11C1]|uniref:hypothetical protein n=1 Tax=unclassified Microcoleus TaxID=2642155 RepID=UPI002FCF10B5